MWLLTCCCRLSRHALNIPSRATKLYCQRLSYSHEEVFYFPTRYDDILRQCGCPLSAELQPIRRTSGYRLTAGGACLDRPASMDTRREGCGERGSQSLLAGEMEDNPRPRNGYCAPTITRVSPLTTTVSILISTTSPHLRFHTGVETRRPTVSAKHCIKVGTTAFYEP